MAEVKRQVAMETKEQLHLEVYDEDFNKWVQLCEEDAALRTLRKSACV